MGYMRFNYKSRELGRYVDVSIVYPIERYTYDLDVHPAASRPTKQYLPMEPGMKFRTVYLIHGGGDDDTMIYRYTAAERYARENNVMLVSPNLVHSFGLDTEYHVNYQSFLAKELPVVMQTFFASSPRREDNYIMGFAMGGNVALGTAILNPDKYSVCVDMSGGIGMTLNNDTLIKELQSDHFTKEFPLFVSSFPPYDQIENSRVDLYHTLQKNLKEGVPQPKYYIACGEKEFVRERVEADYRTMKQLGADVTYEMVEGADHNWPFWDMYIEKALKELI